MADTAAPTIPTRVLTPVFRLSFPYLFKARIDPKGKKDPMFELVMLFPKAENLEALKTAARVAALARWPDAASRPTLKNPFRDGNEKKLDGYKDTITVRASSSKQPAIYDGQRLPITQESLVYAGCYCRATVNAFAYDTDGNRGVSFGILGLQKVRDGQAFGPSCDPEDFPLEPIGATGAQTAPPVRTAAPAAVAGDDLRF